MINLNHIQHYYFVGIGGIGMSALARYFKAQGSFVAGYDKTSTELTRKLEAEGIEVNYQDEIEMLPQEIIQNKEKSLIVYTPAIPKEHIQFNHLRKEGFKMVKRAKLLGLISEKITTLAVAGTHGKTTTTAILGHILKETGARVTAFLGGISEDIDSNLILQGNDVIVAEADEFDRSFLNLSPNIAAVTSMDADHLDIYGDGDALIDSFNDFAARISSGGKLIIKKGLPLNGLTVAVNEKADYFSENVKIEDGHYIFDLNTPTGKIENIKFNLPGKHNLLNAITALAMAIEYGSPTTNDDLAGALSSFRGVKRRFSYKINTNELVLIDDYAHHPTEISAVHQAVREMYPNKEILAVFQPHLFSRTRDFAEEFASSLSQFDEVILLDIYPARELPMEGISSAWLLEKIKTKNKQLVQKSELEKVIRSSGKKIIVMMGAGDIGEEVEKVKKFMLNEA